MAVNFIYKLRGRSIVSDKPKKYIFNAGFPAVYNIQDVCNVDQFVKSSGSLSLSVKDNCSQKIPTDYIRFSWTALGTLPAYNKFTIDPNTTHRPVDYLASNLRAWLLNLDAGTTPAGFIGRGSSLILPFAGGTETEVILTGDVSQVYDICNPTTSTGQVVRVSATQFGYTEDCEKFVRTSVSAKLFTNTNIYATTGAGFDDLLAPNLSPISVILATMNGVATQADAITGYTSKVDSQGTYGS